MGYRETVSPTGLEALVEAAWVSDGGDARVRVLPDACMDLIWMDGHIVVAGPDTSAFLTTRGQEPLAGLRFRPGVLPRLLGVPAAELVNQRVPLDQLCAAPTQTRLETVALELARRRTRTETAPWSLDALRQITASMALGSSVDRVARDTGWSARTLQRQCQAVYGYGPAMLRRILRFRRAVAQLQAGRAAADVAADSGYADQPHLHREVRAFAGATVTSLTAG
jgi:AraC-like DNA-binding protein